MSTRSGKKFTVDANDDQEEKKEDLELLTLTRQQEGHEASQADSVKSSHKLSHKSSHQSSHKSSHKSSHQSSHKSSHQSSHKSSRSSISSSYLKAKAKAKAAQAEVAFAEEQAAVMKHKAELDRQKADLDANLHVLQSQRAAAAASAEAAAYKVAEESQCREEDQEPPVLQLPQPTLIECDIVPDDTTEIPSPEIAHDHSHLQPVAEKIHPVDPDAPILLLLGKDILGVHKVREQINGPHNAPYAQRLDLESVIVGEVCLGTVHKPSEVSVYKENVQQNCHISCFNPYPKGIQVMEGYSGMTQHPGSTSAACKEDAGPTERTDNHGCSVFEQSKDDAKPVLSMDDRMFLPIMDKHVYQDKDRNGVTRIRRSTHPDQWFYVATDMNHADHATRSIPAADLQRSSWFSGPAFLSQSNTKDTSESSLFNLVEPEAGAEIQPEVTTLSTKAFKCQLSPEHFKRFSSWRSSSWRILCQTTGHLIHVSTSFRGTSDNTGSEGWKCFLDTVSVSELSQAKDLPMDRPPLKPPFTSVGLGVFGPRTSMTRHTRGSSSDSNCWAVHFTCMSTRAAHTELIESMPTDNFTNALKDGAVKMFLRPVSEIVVLLSEET